MIKRTAVISVAALLSACATVPQRNATLEEARSAYSSAINNQEIVRYAPISLNEARDELALAERLNRGQSDEPAVMHHAYLSKTHVAIARETAQLKAAEQTIQNATAEREALVLQARAREAQLEAKQAEMGREMAEAKARAAEDARQQSAAQAKAAEEARLAAIDQARQAELAQQQAAALAAAREAEIALQQEAARQKLEALAAELAAKETERGLVLTLGNVLFDVDGHQLKPGAVPAMDKLSEFLKAYPDRNVVIEGFTDSTGSDAYNRNLSEQRANAVKQALMSRGVEENRIATEGFGEARPVATNETAAGRQQNRRVEVVIPNVGGVSGRKAVPAR
jgi:outer membrane protein OmpA-like peptidoglycan-associated protein